MIDVADMNLESSSESCVEGKISSGCFYLRPFRTRDKDIINCLFSNAHEQTIRTLTNKYAIDCISAMLNSKRAEAFPSSNAIDPISKSRTYTIVACRRSKNDHKVSPRSSIVTYDDEYNIKRSGDGIDVHIQDVDTSEDLIAGAVSYVCDVNHTHGRLETLCVAPECQRQGIARMLIQGVISLARRLLTEGTAGTGKVTARGILKLGTPHDNVVAQHLYEAFGFRQVGTDALGADDENAKSFHLKLYELELVP
ncbi:hypothetical protein SARC_01723 [Sphaeroforma arctica JP610]|uniref:N-acetyltransferase domain-containing protein n=1 Tax=Sphaeroforma arctica JP610 TaxID=667725 RepID=A0A0L0GAT0_9EUKA|nr:hypothetical protein SARC_01723 [Sphaeroforma arctica JP610]KNC86107.1 hypothetical protein SARC_01723 [Sphaeroforma arctica JP610]|eukprot:XP_014160009.1 hypothetical protein SARC_01723 [Sphaeroforma arctica JP610]